MCGITDCSSNCPTCCSPGSSTSPRSRTISMFSIRPQRRLIGRQSRRRFSVGDQLRVFVARVDVFKRQVDFAIAERRRRQSESAPGLTARRRPGASPVEAAPAKASCGAGAAQNLLPFRRMSSLDSGAVFEMDSIHRSEGSSRSNGSVFMSSFARTSAGKFLRITEEAHGRRNTIIVPSTGVNDFTAAIGEVLGAGQRAADS